MLKKLRLKFILINMIIVTIMFGVIFSLLYYSTSKNLERESMQMMKAISMNPIKPGPPNQRNEEVRLPYFSVRINHAGEITEIGGGFFDMSDTEYLNTLLKAANDTQAPTGVLTEYNLRFFRSETPMGQCIVFADMTSEKSTLRNMIRTFLMIGSAAFLAFLGISILLARWAVRPVDEAWRQQKQFVADASHELKTPLTVIMTDAELLRAPNCPKADREILSESILTMSRQMRGLVENLLDLARIDNGSVKAEFGSVSMSEIVSDAALMFEPVFFEKGLTLRYEIDPDICINGISAHLTQLISILLDNAAKYSAAGGETFVRFRRATRKSCLLEVANQGDPIDKEDIKNIFKRFYRADKVRPMNQSCGLGLSIAQSIADEHHGKIWVESREGYNRFYVEIPCKKSI